MWKFLESEMKVIYGLSEDAYRTDAVIADLFGLKKGTVASIRRRLLDAGAMFYANVPAFHKLGCEMLGIHIGTTEPSERMDAKSNDYMEFCNEAPQIFEGLIGGNSVVLFTAFRNATEYDSFIQSHNRFFTGTRRSSKARLKSTVFPFALSRGLYVPSFAPVVRRFFELDVPPPKEKALVPVTVENPSLSETEKRTLIALVENPMASDREIATKVKLSRQAVTRIRNKLEDDRMISKVCVPRLYKWGFEIFAIAHAWFNMELSWEKRLSTQPSRVVNSSFYFISKPDESIASYLVSKYSEYSDSLDEVMAWYHKHSAFDEKPEVTLFPLERSVELRTFDYGPVVRHLLS